MVGSHKSLWLITASHLKSGACPRRVQAKTAAVPAPTRIPSHAQGPSGGPAAAAAPRRQLNPASFLPEELSRRLDDGDELRHRLDAQVLAAPERIGAKRPPSETGRRVASALLEKSSELYKAGRFDEAIVALQGAIAADPDEPRAHYDLGLALMCCCRHEEAAAAEERAIALKPDFADAYCLLATAYVALGREADAIVVLRRTVELAPKMVRALFDLGQLLNTAQQTDEAREVFRRTTAAARGTTPGLVAEAFLLTIDGRYAEALPILRNAVARDPANYVAVMQLGHALSALGEADQAVETFKRARALTEDPLHAWLGITKMKRMTEADLPLIAEIGAFAERETSLPRTA